MNSVAGELIKHAKKRKEKKMAKLLSRSHKFILGELREGGEILSTGNKSDLETFSLPFDDILLEYTTKINAEVYYHATLFRQIATENETKTKCFQFIKLPGDDWEVLWSVMEFPENIIREVLLVSYEDPEAMPDNVLKTEIELSKLNVVVLTGFLEVLACNNVKTEEHPPTKAQQKRRKRKHKLPLFSYHTLVIGGKSSRSSGELGGAHASPRVHFRRGHVRRLPSGETTWVNACMVGSKELGFVGKDYLVTNN